MLGGRVLGGRVLGGRVLGGGAPPVVVGGRLVGVLVRVEVGSVEVGVAGPDGDPGALEVAPGGRAWVDGLPRRVRTPTTSSAIPASANAMPTSRVTRGPDLVGGPPVPHDPDVTGSPGRSGSSSWNT